MREIKFRVYSKENEMMYEWDDLMAMDSFKDHMDIGAAGDQAYSPMMQYIGLKDRNGKEIYEGDILATSNSDPDYDDWAKEDFGYTVVEWDPKNTCFHGTKWQWEDNKKENVYDLEFVEVIGNIHEHPHLLEGGEPV